MRKRTKELISKNESYISALEEAIELWHNNTGLEEKKEYIRVIGEIGRLIYLQNIKLFER